MAKGANIKQTKDSDIGRRSDKEEAFDSEQRKRLLDTENDCSTMTSSTVVDSSNIASTSDPENLSNSNSSGDEPVSREKWARKTDFLLSVAGGFVGLGNVWRFPYLCYKNGGGAFLIPYVIFMIGGGIPIFFLEVALGQYMSEGGITSWRLVPIATGIGYASMVIVSLLNIYYIIILAWALFYLFQSFTLELPWAKCDQYWNTACCVPDFKRFNDGNLTNATTMVPSTPATASNATMGYTGNITQCDGNFTSPETEFWERRVLGLSSGLEEIGTVRWELALCLLLAWVICYFCIWKGVKSTGKVVYFTATFPFLMLIVLLIRGVTLPGAIDGIKFYLTPDMERLGDPQVWLDAGTQIFFSYAICLGAMVSLGSYNKFHNNCYLDCIALSLVNSGTSFISGFAIFSVLGFMANEQGVNISQVAESGPGLAFIAYPKAITMMPASTLWAILFFVMLLLLGLDSQFVEVEGFVTSIVDLYPKILRRGHNREIFIALVCFVSYLIGLFMVTNGGMYVFQMFDYYAASGVCLLWVAFFEAFCIAWIYGAEKMWSKIADMIKYRPPPIIKYLWMIVTPLLTTGTFIYSMVKFKPLVYNKIYEYPAWGEGIGWLLALSSMIFIPGYAIYKMVITPGTLQERWTVLTTPNLRRNHVDYVKESKLKERIGGGKEVYSLSVKEENLTSGNPDTVASAPPDYESATSYPNNAQTFTFNTKF